MQNFYISIPNNVIINLRSSEDLEFDELLANAYIPGIKMLPESTQNVSVVIEHIQSNEKKLTVSEGHVTIKDSWGPKYPLDFYHLLYSVARIKFLEQGFYSVHAALAGDILLVGHSGVGKTAIILKLISDYDFKVFSGNKTLVSLEDSISTLAGTLSITTSGKYEDRYANIIEKSVKYGDRIAFTIKNYAQPGKIKAIAIVRLNDGVEENILLNAISALHRLYPYFLDTVNADTILCEGRVVYVGVAPLGIQEKLTLQLKEFLTRIPTYSINGSIDFVCNSISKL